MIEYKVKASMLVFSLLVTLTGSVITLEDWEQLSIEKQIEIVQNNVSLSEAEETLMVDMLKSRDDPQKLAETFSEKVSELHIKADATMNPIEKIKYRDAAEAFEQSLDRLRDLRAMSNTLQSKAEELTNDSLSPVVQSALQRSVDKLKLQYATEEGELKLLLVQGFLALKIAEQAQTVLQDKQQEVEKEKPLLSELSLAGILTFVIGLVGSVLASAKLFVEYKKAKLELELVKAKSSG